MPKFAGYLFLTIGLIAALFLITYSGTAISNKELWIVFSIFFVIIGGFLIVQQKFDTFRQKLIGGNLYSRNKYLTNTGEKIRVTPDNCEIKCGSFQQEASGERLPGNTQQTYILFTKAFDDKMYTFISPPTTQSPEVVRKYLVSNKGINLYIDRQNPATYYFDIGV